MFHTRPQVPGHGQLMVLHVLQLVGKALEASVASRSPTRELSTRGAPTNQGMSFLLLRRSWYLTTFQGVQQHRCLLVVLDGVPLKETSTASTSMALLETHGYAPIQFAITFYNHIQDDDIWDHQKPHFYSGVHCISWIYELRFSSSLFVLKILPNFFYTFIQLSIILYLPQKYVGFCDNSCPSAWAPILWISNCTEICPIENTESSNVQNVLLQN